MAYATGTATDPNDLLQKLVTFLAANGWTSDTSTADSSAWKACLHRGSVYMNFRTAINEYNSTLWGGGTYSSTGVYGLCFYAGTGNGASSSPWYNGAGAPVGSGQTYKVGAAIRLPSGSITAYHFFIDAAQDNFCGVIESSPGVFVNFGFGASLNKAGSWTGGEYFWGTVSGYEINITGLTYGVSVNQQAPFTYYPSGAMAGAHAFVRADVDTYTSKWLANGNTAGAAYGYTGRYCECALYNNSAGSANYPRYDGIKDRTHNTANGSPILMPIPVYVNRDAGGYSLLGNVPNVYATNAVGNGNNAGDVLTIGSDSYKLFPNFAVKKVT